MKLPGKNLLSVLLPPTVVLLVTTACLEALLRIAHVPRYMMPLPSSIIMALAHSADELGPALGYTTESTLIGFAASAIIGVSLAIILSASALTRRAFYPYTIFFQTVPIVAIAPMLLFWMDSGPLSVGVCAFIVSVFPVIANTLAGLMSTDPALIDLFRLYGASPVEAMWKLRLPSALPNILTGLRVAAGLAVIGTVVAEFLVGQSIGKAGLGILVVDGIHQAHLDIAFAAVLLASLLGLAMFAAVNLAGWLSLRRWHASARQLP